MCIKSKVNKTEGNLWALKENDWKIERKEIGLYFYMNAGRNPPLSELC
jgi:hypothetical protein